MYDLTFMDTSNNLLDLVIAVNDASHKVLFSGILLLLFLVIFISTKRYGTNTAMISSSGITSIIGLLFMFVDLVKWQIVIVPFVLLLISLAIDRFSD